MAQYTPMIEQYLRIKAQHKDAFLFFRLGDFYELFFDDAIKAAQELEITLTKRGGQDPIPMCGVPHHSADLYISKLIDKGYKIAICEQMEDPQQAKGIVRREVIQVITPGTVMDNSMIDEKKNNFISAISFFNKDQFGLATSDITTGESRVTLISGGWEALVTELSTLKPREIILSPTSDMSFQNKVMTHFPVVISYEDKTDVGLEFQRVIAHLDEEKLVTTFGRLLNYLLRTQKRSLDHLQTVQVYNVNQFLKIDSYSKRNLELLDTIRDQDRKGSLVWLLDKTVTAMGGRELKQWIERPLIQKNEIERRLNMLESFKEHFILREEIREILKQIYDLERLAGKISFGSINARDLIQLKQSLVQVPKLIQSCSQLNCPDINELISRLPSFTDLTALLGRALLDDPAPTLKEGGIIRDGYHEELDTYREITKNGKTWIKELEQNEREATGIKSLKIGFNRVFGYYIEITKANLHLLPEGRYERKQTLANSERYITKELKEIETKMLEAEEKMHDLEYTLFLQLRDKVKESINDFQFVAKRISEIDVLQGLAIVSEEHHYVRPSFHETDLQIKNGRHPVVEKVLLDTHYVENDIQLNKEEYMLLITGPNMSGKSTYMRQLALIAIMAQMGSFVPADEAILPIFDQIFTRIGAADDLVSGQSTFMVEMLETNYALANATERSLILLDEIGRGTSTYDGMALAQAIIEYIHNEIGAKTLFSTHYHELTVLEDHLPHLKNIHVKAIEENDEVVFLYKVHPGAADKSYGIHVAKLAELPQLLIERARALLQTFEALSNKEISASHESMQEERQTSQLSFFEESLIENESVEGSIIQELTNINLLEMTPLEAMNSLYELQEKAKATLKKR